MSVSQTFWLLAWSSCEEKSEKYAVFYAKKIWEARFQVSRLHPDCVCWGFEWDFRWVHDHMPTGHQCQRSELLSHSAASKETMLRAGCGTRGPVSRLRVEGMPHIFLTREPWTPFWDCGVPRLEKMDLYIDWMFILSNSKRDEGESGLSNNVPMPATPLALESNHQIFTEWLTPPLLIQHPSNLCLRFIMCEYKEHVARWRRGQLS